MVADLIKKFFENESGQTTAEYGALIAFAAMFVAILFTFGRGSLGAALKGSFSGITNNINQLAAGAS